MSLWMKMLFIPIQLVSHYHFWKVYNLFNHLRFSVIVGGTPAFRAPETLLGDQRLYSGKAADIWALGITLFALIYG